MTEFHDHEDQREAYEGVSEVYSDPFGLIKRDNRNHRKKQSIILETTIATAGDRVLEVGCGDGLHSVRYADEFELTAIDLSESLVSRTQARLGDSGRAVQGNALDLEFPDDSFDAVVGTAILHHLPDIRSGLSEWLRVTKPGGSVTVMEPNYLFPKDFVTAHVVEAEKHKTQMAPWHVRRVLDGLEAEFGASVEHAPKLFTPPWPAACSDMFDRVDSLAGRVPVLRWIGQMQLIHVEI